jgi:hypothetical protein
LTTAFVRCQAGSSESPADPVSAFSWREMIVLPGHLPFAWIE